VLFRSHEEKKFGLFEAHVVSEFTNFKKWLRKKEHCGAAWGSNGRYAFELPFVGGG
jgi:hypothetical protein